MKQIIRAQFLLLSLLALSFSTQAELADKKEVFGPKCEYFVQRLIEEDYRALITLEIHDINVGYDCLKAIEAEPDNPVYQFGRAISMQLGVPNAQSYDIISAFYAMRLRQAMNPLSSSFSVICGRNWTWRMPFKEEDGFCAILRYGIPPSPS